MTLAANLFFDILLSIKGAPADGKAVPPPAGPPSPCRAAAADKSLFKRTDAFNSNSGIKMSEFILTATDANFKETVSAADKPVFVDFWAPWCGPCRMLAPSLDAAAEQYNGRAVIAKYNVDENSQVATENNIRGIPTLLVYKNGEIVGQHTGAMGKSELMAFIEQYL